MGMNMGLNGFLANYARKVKWNVANVGENFTVKNVNVVFRIIKLLSLVVRRRSSNMSGSSGICTLRLMLDTGNTEIGGTKQNAQQPSKPCKLQKTDSKQFLQKQQATRSNSLQSTSTSTGSSLSPLKYPFSEPANLAELEAFCRNIKKSAQIGYRHYN